MIIEFLGCPRSGKTTTAARVFANLKEAGFNCEFVPEQARFYIAQKRVALELKPSDSMVLDDIDQFNIMQKQFDAQNIMLGACGSDALIVTDSSILNTLLYMTRQINGPNAERILEMLSSYRVTPKMTFYATPVEWVGGLDPNRIHSKEQSEAIDLDIREYLIPMWTNGYTTLVGDTDMRWRQATSEIFRVIMEKNVN